MLVLATFCPIFTDDFIQLDQPLGSGLRESAQNGVGTISSVNKHFTGFSNPYPQNDPYSSGYFDGQNYASTYQANGECHLYQELCHSSTTTVPPPLPHRLSNISHVSSKEKSNSVTRFSINSNPVIQFPYSMPVSSSASYPYLEAVPTTSSQVQPQTPQDTPVSVDVKDL